MSSNDVQNGIVVIAADTSVISSTFTPIGEAFTVLGQVTSGSGAYSVQLQGGILLSSTTASDWVNVGSAVNISATNSPSIISPIQATQWPGYRLVIASSDAISVRYAVQQSSL